MAEEKKADTKSEAAKRRAAQEKETKELLADDDVNRKAEGVAAEMGRRRFRDAEETGTNRSGKAAEAAEEELARSYGNLGGMLVNPREIPKDTPYAPARHTGTPGGKSPKSKKGSE